MTVSRYTRPTELYRHYNAKGRLLYVGISLATAARTAQHKASASWWDEVAKITIQRFPDRDAALKAEQAAIKGEHPLYNRQGLKAVA